MKKSVIFLLILFLSSTGIFSQPVLKDASSVNEYSIVYELYDGTNSPDNKDCYEENATVVLSSPVRNGYRFDGWFWDDSFKSPLAENTFSNKKGALKVYAKWIKQLDLSSYYNDNMVEIIPDGKKVTLENFANTEGPQDIFSYSISKYEITQELYLAVTGKNLSYFKGEKLPVENVTWYDAVNFCNELTKQTLGEEYCCYRIGSIYRNDDGNITSAYITLDKEKKGYRLPTSAEWEMAARGGIKGGWDYKYSGSNDCNEIAWFESNSSYKTHEVGRKKPNAAGLYDMTGNVMEWCGDIHYNRIIRGGSYANYYSKLEVSGWKNNDESVHYSNLGFRIACTFTEADRIEAEKRAEEKRLEAERIAAEKAEAERIVAEQRRSVEDNMVQIPSMGFKMLKTEVTQELYYVVMEEKPSKFNGKNYPENYVSWYDAIYFCNKLSEQCGLEPVYSVDGETDVTKWNYTPRKENKIDGEVTQNTSASGYRLPTNEEWEYAARGGENYTYAGSNDIDEVAWYYDNSGHKTHPVAQKKANGYGLYDMSGNVWEWVWDVDPNFDYNRYSRGGSWYGARYFCGVDCIDRNNASYQSNYLGFRIVRSSK